MFEIKNKIPPSSTVLINSLAIKKKSLGFQVYNLSAGEPIIPTHPLVIQGAEQALRTGKTHYAPTMGIPELRASASGWMNRMYQTNYSADQTLVTCGGKFGLYALCRTLLGVGDEGIIIAPYWVSYPSLIEMTGARVKVIQTTEQSGWKITPDQLRLAITSRTKIIFFNNACNPTGAIYSRDQIYELLTVAKEKNVLFISDEVYSGLTYDGEFVSAGSFPEFSENVVVIQSVSKHFAMTGWRVGLVFGDARLLTILGDLQSQSTTGTSTISQWAAVTAFQNAEQIIDSVKNEMKLRRDALSTILEQKFGKKFSSPSGLYLLVSLADLGVKEINSNAWCQKVLEEANVALVPGSAFGVEAYVRFSFGEKESELVAAVEALVEYLKK